MSTRINNTAPAEWTRELPSSLDQQLKSFRTRLRMLKMIEVAFAALIGFLIAYLVVFTTERFWAMPAWTRTLMLLAGTAGFSIGLPMAMRRWLWNTRRLEQVARFLRTAFPVLGDEILSVIEMMDNEGQQGASPRLIAAATDRTSSRVAEKDLAEAAPSSASRRRAFIALGIASVAALLACVVPSAARNSWQRFLSPWSNTPRFTFAQFGDLPERQVVPYGESFELPVPLQSNSQWKPATAAATLGPTRFTASLNSDADVYRFSLPGQTQPSALQISAGDVSNNIDIVPMTRPELTSITAKIIPPAYLQYSEPIQQTSTARRFSALPGSTIEFDLLANRDVASASLDGLSIPVNGQHVTPPRHTVTGDEQLTVNWRDQHQLEPSRPIELQIQSRTDQAPTIVLEQFPNRVLLESRSLNFSFAGRDDFGIRQVGLQWTGQLDPVNNPNPAEGEKLLVAGDPQTQSLREQGIFSPRLEGVKPQVLTLRLFIEDYLPEHGRIYSRPQTLHLMSHDDHVAWVNENMQRWKSTADAIYERELGLAEQNQQLQRLTDQQRSEAENLRRLENQVAAERDNAQRLDRAVNEGRELIEQAMMNANMRADQVAQWAESLAALQEIANRDMPRVADQLAAIDQLARTNQRPSDRTENPEPNTSAAPPAQAAGMDRGPTAPESNPDDSNTDDPQTNDHPNGDGNAPQLLDRESSMLERGEPQNDGGGGGRLTLPTTDLANPKQDEPPQPSGDNEEQPTQNPAADPQQPDMDDVVEEQQKLLREFEQARDAMDEVMDDFENSTFIKRLKAASRTQLQIASQLNRLVSRGFGDRQGLPGSAAETINDLMGTQQQIYESLNRLSVDLEAYQSREPEDSRQSILDEMSSLKMLVKLNEMPQRLKRNRLGDGIHRSEFWGDTFDRWAEELVPPAQAGGGGGDGDAQPSLPPAIVLDVLRQIEDEMNLRDETRGFDRARAAMPTVEQQQRSDGLTVFQMETQERSLNTIDDILAIPNGGRDFGGEISRLKSAVTAMDEATGMLFDRTTGNPTLAAESAAIEALLDSRRQNPPANDNPAASDSENDGSESLADSRSAMDLLGPGQSAQRRVQPRDVGAGTAATFDNVPERYRSGIDNFTNALNRLKK